MSTARKPIGDLGPEFVRRLDRQFQKAARSTALAFSRGMFEIARTADRFERADRIQAECDRLLALSDDSATPAED